MRECKGYWEHFFRIAYVDNDAEVIGIVFEDE